MSLSEALVKNRADILRELEEAYLRRADWEVRENANTNFSYSNFRNYLFEKLVKSGNVIASYLPPESVGMHFNGDIHIHKLPDSLWIPYCTGWSYRKVLESGLRTPGIVSSPAKHFDTAVSHLVNFFFMGAQEFTGAQATIIWSALGLSKLSKACFSSLITLLGPDINPPLPI
ncbi:MAG: anaerobic ribonucleoside-triphosphate reductase [Thermofilaceae archaeon]